MHDRHGCRRELVYTCGESRCQTSPRLSAPIALHVATRQQPTMSLPRQCALLAERTASSSSASVPTTAGCPRGLTRCINRWNAWQQHPTARASCHCVTRYQGQHSRRMLPRRLVWRRSRQKLHGRLRRRHRRSAHQWLVHMQRWQLSRQTRGTMPTGWGLNSRSTRYVTACEALTITK